MFKLNALFKPAPAKQKLTWIFKPAPGYNFSIAHAIDPKTGEHVGHVNAVAYASSESFTVNGEEICFYATVKSDEDANRLGGELGADTLATAMEQLEYRIEHGDWPRGYWGGPVA